MFIMFTDLFCETFSANRFHIFSKSCSRNVKKTAILHNSIKKRFWGRFNFCSKSHFWIEKLRKFQSQIKLYFFASKLSLSKNVYGKYLTPLLAEILFSSIDWNSNVYITKKTNNIDCKKKIHYKKFLYTRIFFVQYKNL